MYINIVAAVHLMALVTGVLQAAPPSNVRASQATFAETKHDFGMVTQGTSLSHTFVLRNEGSSPVKIEGVDLQAPGMKTSFKPVIGTGESGRITLEWSTTSLEGPVEAKAVVRFADPERPRVELMLTATVKQSLDILPMPAVFFSVYKGDTATRSVTIVNRESRPLEITGIEPAGDHFEATITPLKPGESYRLDVTVPRTTAPGRFMEAVYLKTNHPTLSRLKIAVNVLVKNDLYVNPEILDLGRISLTELSANPALVKLLTQKLIVRKREGDFAVTSISTNVPALKVTASAEGRAQAFEIEVLVIRERLTAGRLTGTIRIETDDKDFPLLEVPVVADVR
jgi:hypothetical protein